VGWRLTRGNSREGRRERLGFGTPLPGRSDRIWLHGASVGEMMALKPIAEEFHRRRPDTPVVVSTITPTGQEQARKAFSWAEQVRYLPLDAPGPVSRAMSQVRPAVVGLVETELWPNFVHAAASRGVVVMLNGRISDRTFRPALRFRAFYRWVLRQLAIIGAQTTADAERFLALGAPEDRVRVLGTSKFDEPVPLLDDESRARWRRDLGIGDDPCLVAGSTFPGEEEAVVSAFLAARRIRPSLRLIIAPRHVQRADEVERVAASAGLMVLRRSEGRPGAADVVIVDTYGELAALYGLAEAAFIGRSLTERGGQNLIQPMAHGVPVVSGPNMQNFRDVAEQAEAVGALQRVADAGGLTVAWQNLLSSSDERRRRGEAGRELVARNRGAASRYADVLEEALGIARGFGAS
jgi:3-deoxy-D-manno-octulosonic-acid transferase